MEQPLVSVIIPAYNAAPYVAQAIESVLAQSYKNVEIIVVEGPSTDGTKAVLDPYIEKKQIAYLRQDRKGLSNARNNAMRIARGEFIAFLDVDDLFLPMRIEKQVAYFSAHPKCDVCYVDAWHFMDNDPQKLLKLNYTYYSGDAALPNLLKKNFIAPSSVMVRRTVVQRIGVFSEDLRRSEDWEYWMRLAQHGAMICFIPEILGKIRLHEGSMSSGWRSKQEEGETNLRILTGLRKEMSPEDRDRLEIDRAILICRMKLWYVYSGKYFIPLQWLHRWIQRNRLK